MCQRQIATMSVAILRWPRVVYCVICCSGLCRFQYFPRSSKTRLYSNAECVNVQIVFFLSFITKQPTLNVHFLWQDGFIDRVSEKWAQSSLELYTHIAIKSDKKSNKHAGKQIFYLKLCKKQNKQLRDQRYKYHLNQWYYEITSQNIETREAYIKLFSLNQDN